MKDRTDRKTDEMFHDQPHVMAPNLVEKFDVWMKDGCKKPFWEWLKEESGSK